MNLKGTVKPIYFVFPIFMIITGTFLIVYFMIPKNKASNNNPTATATPFILGESIEIPTDTNSLDIQTNSPTPATAKKSATQTPKSTSTPINNPSSNTANPTTTATSNQSATPTITPFNTTTPLPTSTPAPTFAPTPIPPTPTPDTRPFEATKNETTEGDNKTVTITANKNLSSCTYSVCSYGSSHGITVCGNHSGNINGTICVFTYSNPQWLDYSSVQSIYGETKEFP